MRRQRASSKKLTQKLAKSKMCTVAIDLMAIAIKNAARCSEALSEQGFQIY
jgi:hypothetical protein